MSSHTPTPPEWYTLPPARPTTYVLPLPPASLAPERNGFVLIDIFLLQHAIDIAKDSFVELKDVERERISLEVHVVLKNQQARRTAEIGRTAWPVVVASLARFEIVEIRVASGPPVPSKHMGALSSSQSSISEPPPYVSEKGWYSDYSNSQTNLVPCRQQISSSQSPSLATRVVDLLTPKSSRSRLSPQPYQF
jgi:hypothetical protein